MIPILFEDNHCLAVDKPAGLLSQGDETGAESVVDLVREDLRVRYRKPGNVFVGLIHRLDRPVSGVVLLAKTSKGAARLSEQFRDRAVEKNYWAIVEGLIDADEGTWTDSLRKDERRNIVEVVGPDQGGMEAGVAFKVLDRRLKTTLVELKPTTGRGHQLRIQLASRGFPIFGDKKYGATRGLKARDGGHRIALHARSLTFTHPTRKQAISVTSPEPADWPRHVHPS